MLHYCFVLTLSLPHLFFVPSIGATNVHCYYDTAEALVCESCKVVYAKSDFITDKYKFAKIYKGECDKIPNDGYDKDGAFCRTEKEWVYCYCGTDQCDKGSLPFQDKALQKFFLAYPDLAPTTPSPSITLSSFFSLTSAGLWWVSGGLFIALTAALPLIIFCVKIKWYASVFNRMVRRGKVVGPKKGAAHDEAPPPPDEFDSENEESKVSASVSQATTVRQSGESAESNVESRGETPSLIAAKSKKNEPSSNLTMVDQTASAASQVKNIP